MNALAGVQAHVSAAQEAAQSAFGYADRAEHAPDPAASRQMAHEAREAARTASRQSAAALGLLQDMVSVDDLAPVALASAVPFHQLDTPDVRALAAGLRELLPLAERIDAARGRALPEVVGGSAGLDLAEDLAQMVARLELEAYGPAAAVTGGRE